MSFAGKTIVVTGGSSGIGLALINSLLLRGAKNIANLDFNDSNESTAQLQSQYPNAQVVYVKTDVSDRDNVFRAFEQIRSRFESIDVVIGNAGIMNELLPVQTVQVNLIGVINSTHAAIEFMGKPNGGNGGIVMNIASVLGLDYLSAYPVYTASKHGVVAFTRAFADDLYKHLGISFVAVCPGRTNTPIRIDAMKKIRPEVNHIEIDRYLAAAQDQTSEELSELLANILEKPTEATVYIADGGKVRSVDLPFYWKTF